MFFLTILSHRPVRQVPIVNAVGYGYEDVDEWYAVATGDAVGHIYSRNTNPTVRAFEKKVQQLEGAEDCIAFSSGSELYYCEFRLKRPLFSTVSC